MENYEYNILDFSRSKIKLLNGGKGGVYVWEDTGEQSFLSVSNLHARTHKNSENIKQETFPV